MEMYGCATTRLAFRRFPFGHATKKFTNRAAAEPCAGPSTAFAYEYANEVGCGCLRERYAKVYREVGSV